MENNILEYLYCIYKPTIAYVNISGDMDKLLIKKLLTVYYAFA